jgi:hypothetical protein
MLLRNCAALAVFCVALPVDAWAAADFSDRQFVTAVGQMVATDSLAERCPEARKSGTAVASALKDWERRNAIPALRQAVTAAQADDTCRRTFQTLKVSMWSQAAAVPASSSAAAAPRETSVPKGVLGYGLIQSSGLGYGGMVAVIYKPVVLFTSGDILLEVKGLADPGGIAADRAANPARWSTWRKTGGKYEYAGKSGTWRPILNNQVWTEPPSTSALQGRFVATGGTGNTAMGGTSAVFAQTTYRFLPGGRLIREGFASSSSEASGGGSTTSVVMGSKGERAGRYTIDGLTLKVTFDDGRQDSAILMTHPTDKDIIWINGIAYTRE